MADTHLSEALHAQITRSRIALSLASSAGDMPLQLVNDPFCRLTGYAARDVQGLNCRFLQGADTPPEQVQAMSSFLMDNARDDGRFPVVNYTAGGRRFINLVFMSKLRGSDGKVRFVLASQFNGSAAEEASARSQHDRELSRNVADLRRAAGQFGLIMTDSTGLIARSISTLARITVRDE